MRLDFEELQYIVGGEETIQNMPSLKPMRPFSEEAVGFLSSLSKRVLHSGKDLPDAATFGFWCRKAALLNEKAKYDDLDKRLGKGLVFHSTPSNVPVNFAFSFAAGLLAGNANIVRLPARDFPQVALICGHINELLSGEFKEMAPYVCMVKYPPNKEISDAFSSICDGRVVWGGDGTIANMRKSEMKPRAGEVAFADRYSIAAIRADEYLKANNKERIAADFYNDTFLSDQNACTSPMLIAWLGEDKAAAKKVFWAEAHKVAAAEYGLTAVQAVGKLAALYKIAAERQVFLEPQTDNLIYRVTVYEIDEGIMKYKHNSGFFFEYDAESLFDLLPICGSKCQTITYYGLSASEIEDFFEKGRPRGVDRVVPIGKSMDFALVWDGYDLIRELSRKYTII